MTAYIKPPKSPPLSHRFIFDCRVRKPVGTACHICQYLETTDNRFTRNWVFIEVQGGLAVCLSSHGDHLHHERLSPS